MVQERETSEIMQDTITNLVKGISGIAASEKQEIILSFGHILQRIRGGNFLDQVRKEWNLFKEKGKIKDDYQFTEQNYQCLQELLDFLEKDLPDEVRVNILKKIYIVCATEDYSSREDILPVQFMKIARKISVGEWLILSTCYRMNKGTVKISVSMNKLQSARAWCEELAKHSGLEYPSLVQYHEQGLIDKRLITGRINSNKRVVLGDHLRLSDLGLSFCEYIDKYGNLKEELFA